MVVVEDDGADDAPLTPPAAARLVVCPAPPCPIEVVEFLVLEIAVGRWAAGATAGGPVPTGAVAGLRAGTDDCPCPYSARD